MVPYEAPYGRKCKSPLCWDAVGEKAMLGPDWVPKENGEGSTEVRHHILVAHSRQ
jgi:hypothetical protein